MLTLFLLAALCLLGWIVWNTARQVPLIYTVIIRAFGCVLVWGIWQENRHKLQQKGQPDKCDAQPSAMPPEPTGAESDG